MLFLTLSKQLREITTALEKIARGTDNEITVPAQGEMAQLISAINSVVEALKKEINTLRQDNNQIKTMLEGMVEGVIAIDKEKKILSINPAVEKIFNISKDQVLGRFFLETIRNNDIFEVINGVLEKKEFLAKEITLLGPTHKIFRISVSPLFDNTTVNGCVLVIYDITEIRKLELLRSEFFANVSHELKTPLTSIRGFVETLLEGAWEDKDNSRNFLEIIQTHANRLDNLINDLLELSRIESREIILKSERIQLKALVDATAQDLRTQLAKKNIILYNELSNDVFVTADTNQLRRVLTNLIDNAIKFNKEKGTIKIYSENADKE
ncbi:MAG: histidine kinase dimerization/phospho-acceptor domain-containing protein, partial [Candidatus Omnitrophica bacterium]|nr:histidine kinase dimerization/phospho-acceptor domain-containing protein [Candidatus Omnitrophota bacterium]